MTQWLDLESAPRDGSKFLANTCDFEYGVAFNRCVQEARWTGNSFASKNGQMITHWMQLPDDPIERPKKPNPSDTSSASAQADDVAQRRRPND